MVPFGDNAWDLGNFEIEKRLNGGSLRQFYCQLQAGNPIAVIGFVFKIF